MRKFKLTSLAISIFCVAFSQTNPYLLCGTWQADQIEVTSMYHDFYIFSNQGNFQFTPDQYNGLNRVISINGKYKIIGDSIYLTPISSKELFGGSFERSMVTTLSDSWEINGGRIKTVILKPKQTQTAQIKVYQDSIVLGGRKFYKVKD